VPPGPPGTGGAKPPELSAVKLSPLRFAARHGTTLKLRASETARISVLITQTITGHKLNGVCKPHARTGRRCTTIARRTLTLLARARANAFKLKLRGLANAAYTATVTAENADGKSRAIKLRFTITHM
jgi:hypothetical protein